MYGHMSIGAEGRTPANGGERDQRVMARAGNPLKAGEGGGGDDTCVDCCLKRVFWEDLVRDEIKLSKKFCCLRQGTLKRVLQR